jgi:glyoxylase-like metal-dependent hydrolase (beta-lactamase superfamily II)
MVKLIGFTTVMNGIDNLLVRNVPVSSAIIEIDSRTLGLIDTGMYGNPELEERLSEFGYRPDDINLVLNTHLHPDHIGGNCLFRNARIIISRKELEHGLEVLKKLHQGEELVSIIQCLSRTTGLQDQRLAQDLKKLYEQYPVPELIGDRSQIEFFEDEPRLPGQLTIRCAPGHSVDSRAIICTGERRSALIAGDALFHRDLWQGAVLNWLHYDPELFKATAEALTAFEGIILPGHDRAFDNSTHQYLKDDFAFL